MYGEVFNQCLKAMIIQKNKPLGSSHGTTHAAYLNINWQMGAGRCPHERNSRRHTWSTLCNGDANKLIYNDWGKHYICYYNVILPLTDSQAEIIYIDTPLFRSDVAINLFVLTTFVFCVCIPRLRTVTVLCIMYVLRYTGIPAYNTCPN